MERLRQAWRSLALRVRSPGLPLLRDTASSHAGSVPQARDGERGQGLAEYSLIIGLIAIAAIAGLLVLGQAITALFWAPISEEFGKVLSSLLGW
jgi:Flp pilus assembly pilin Flp